VRCRGWGLTRGCAPQFGDTPLHAAANQDRLEVVDLLLVKLLLKAGADVTATNKVSERSAGDGGLGVRARRGFGQS